MVTPTDVRKFQAVYTKTFGVDLKPFEAKAKLELLVRQMELVYPPLTEDELQSINVNEKTNEQSKPKPATN